MNTSDFLYLDSVINNNPSLLYEYCIIGIVTLLTGVFLHSGILHKITVKSIRPPLQKLVIAYKVSFTKDEAKSHFDEAQSMLPTYKKIRIIYDKNLHKEGAGPSLVYAIGFILSVNGVKPEEDVKLFMYELGYSIRQFPEMDYALVATHPYRNSFSLDLVRSRLCNSLLSYIKKRCLCAHPRIEIYGDSDILLLAPLLRQDDFYVNEVLPAAAGLWSKRYAGL